MTVPTLPDSYGLPIREGYDFEMELNLLRSQTAGGWTRQRRDWLHNPSVFSLSYRLTIAKAGEMIRWLRLNSGEIGLKLLHGNNTLADCKVEVLNVVRNSDISVERIPFTDKVVLSFTAETLKQTGYYALAQKSREGTLHTPFSSKSVGYSSPLTTFDGLKISPTGRTLYPKDLPPPLAEGFTEVHTATGATDYTMSFAMDSLVLRNWLAFAGFGGTAWFRIKLPVTDTGGCGFTIIRFTSNPQAELIGPDRWRVTVQAESPPHFLSATDLPVDGGTPPPKPPLPGTKSYDEAGVTYDDNKLTYEA